jgi:alpha-beta hydrolase superfamily lysophospholipase
MLSSKDSSKYVAIGEELSRGGVVVVRFDFSGCGDSKWVSGNSLLETRMGNLDAMMKYVCHQPWMDGTLGLLGSSLGGYVALLAAASQDSLVKAVVCWATPFDLKKVKQALEQPEMLKSLHIVSPGPYILGNPENLETLPPVPRVLILHGQQDEIVPWQEAVQIYRCVGEPKQILLMETADHRFLDPLCRKLAMKSSLDWFREQGFMGPADEPPQRVP